MNRILIFEAGSSKTTVLSATLPYQDNEIKTELPGINPNREDTLPLFKKALRELQVRPTDRVYFYGSGLAHEANKEKIRSLFNELVDQKAEVYDDLVGAGRALFGNGSGLFAIMGTGGIVARYKNGVILERRGGYGYLIDDLGGGLELGKYIVSAWLNGDFSKKIDREIRLFLSCKKEDFISVFYQYKDLDKLAKITEIAHEYRAEEEMKHVLESYFNLFFQRHVLPIAMQPVEKTFSLIGSIAYHFWEEITNIALRYSIEAKEVLRYPAKKLLLFHVENNNK